MLKFNIFLFCLSLFITALPAQHIHYEDFLLDNPFNESFTPANGESAEEVIVLDSFVNTRYAEVPYIDDKQIYEYDDQARAITIRGYRYDDIDQVLYQNSINYIVHADLKRIQTIESTNFYGNLIFASRYTDCFDENGTVIEQTTEIFQTGIGTWNNSDRSILTERTDSTEFFDTYSWNAGLGVFTLDGKRETFYNRDFDYENTTYDLDSDGNYIPNLNTQRNYVPGTNYTSYFTYRRFEGAYQAWDSILLWRSEVDIPSLSVYTLRYLKPFGETNIRLVDSIEVEFNDQLQIEKQFYHDVDIAGNTTLDFISEREYLEDGRLLQIHDFESDGTSTRRIGDWYYSTIITDAHEAPAVFPVELTFPNPAQSDDVILVAGNADRANESFDFWITDQQGKIVTQKRVNNNDQISLSDKSLTTGMYYLTLFGESGQRTWKMVLQ